MALRLYNSLTHKKQPFRSIKRGKVGFYTCGPTVYSFAHIGNMRPYIVADLLKRVLIHNGYAVRHVINITDVGHLVSDANLGEDKLRVTAQHERKTVHEIAKFYTDDFMNNMKRLGITMPDAMPKASEHTGIMLGLIDRLYKKGYVYAISTGIYFDTSRFRNYGRLMALTFDDLNNYLISGIRVERAVGTKNTTDFAVWRLSRPSDTEMVWDTKYGKGFPGWHIECSAMSMHYLGEHFDLHSGGIDHLPIHHTNEIAQSESATGKKFVNFWIHNEFLQVDGKKMSKSLGNVYRIEDLLAKGYSAMAYKYFMLSGYYRSQLNFTFEALANAENTLNSIYSFIKRLSDNAENMKQNERFVRKAEKLKKEFFASLNDDLNTPIALSKLHLLITETNKLERISKHDSTTVLNILLDFDKVLGLGFAERAKGEELSTEIKRLIEERERLRKEGRFSEADKIRSDLKADHGIVLEDTESGTVWHKEAKNS